MKKLIVQLVTWNGAKYIPFLFESLRVQTYTNWELVILDNGSSDDTPEVLQREVGNLPAPYTLVEGTENLGFAGGHNKLFKEHDSEYVLLLNQDMYLMPDALANMVRFLDTHADVAAVSPRLMRWDFTALLSAENPPQPPLQGGENTPFLQRSFSDQIDSLGLKVFRNRRVIEKYTGKHWSDVKPKMNMSFRAERFREDGMALEVFGVSGAFPMYRRSALVHVAFQDGTFLDQEYHAYKEDVDLAFRLRSAGYRAFTLIETVAYHDRSALGQEDMRDTHAAHNKKVQSAWVRNNSYKNHLMTLYKNEYWQNWILDAVCIKWYELKKFVWFLIFDRSVLKGLGEIWRLRRALREKRKDILSKRTVSWKDMRSWWI
jgi:GT2 family glycosyltransferase